MIANEERNPEGGLRDIPAKPSPVIVSKDAYHLLTLAELIELKGSPWLIRGVIRQGESVVIYGEPSCGKTFLALDMALRVAAGKDWWGMQAARGAIVYLAGEGVLSLGRRCRAWADQFDGGLGVVQESVRILPHSISIMNDDEFNKLLATLAGECKGSAIIVVDTLARFMAGGDENSTEHMGLFVSRCDMIRAVTGATIIIVHHKGKNAQTERGSSALRGAADVMLEVSKDGDEILVRGTKAKDSDLLPDLRLRLRRVDLGPDEDGEPLVSMNLELITSDAPGPGVPSKEPGAVIRDTLQLVFSGTASGPQLLAASGLGRSSFYSALQTELRQGRLVPHGEKRSLTYSLGNPLAVQSGSQSSPSPTKVPDSVRTGLIVGAESKSKSTLPFRGVDSGLDSDRSRQTSEPQQEEEKGALGTGPAKSASGDAWRKTSDEPPILGDH